MSVQDMGNYYNNWKKTRIFPFGYGKHFSIINFVELTVR